MNLSYRLKIAAFISLYLSFGNLLYAQHVELIIKDSKTSEPIPSVYVTAIKALEKIETVSNPEGKIKLPINCDSITLSHVAYEIGHVSGKQNTQGVLNLVPKITTLENVTVYSIDLREKIKNLLDDFSRFYIANERTYHCTYKETFNVDDSLVRLLQFNITWWNKAYQADLKKSYDIQNQVAVDAVSYSRALEGRAVNSGALTNKSLFAALHLNNYLTGLLMQAKDYTISGIEKTNASTKIFFDASFERGGSVVGNLKDSYFIFDNNTNALVELYTQLIYAPGQVQHAVSKKNNIPIAVTYKRETRTMSFIPDKNNKLRLSYFQFVGEHEDQLPHTTYTSENKLTLYITGAEKGNTISRATKIALEEKPIYEYIENTPKKDPSILLTNEEEQFINGQR